MKLANSLTLLFLCALTYVAEHSDAMAAGFKNNNPVINIFGLPGYSNSKIIQSDTIEVAAAIEWSSIYYLDPANSAAESFVIDAETTHLNFSLLYGLHEKLEIGIIGSFMSISGGILDKWINSWHDTFNLVDHGRDDAPLNDLNIRYAVNDIALFELTESNYGIMDTQLFIGYQIISSNNFPYHQMTMRLSWDAPTGEINKLTGSESNEFALWGDYSRHFNIYNYDMLLSLSAGILKITNPQFLPHLVKDEVLFTGLGMEFALNQNWSLFTFLSNHGQFYTNTSITALNEAAGELDLGVIYQQPAEYQFKFGFREEFNVGVSPDIVLYASYQYKL